jgi:putative transposase
MTPTVPTRFVGPPKAALWIPAVALLLQCRGWAVNHKRLYRLYHAENLAVRRLRRKRLLRPAVPIAQFQRANEEWSMDFVMDGLATGRALRVLTIVDSHTRECLAIEVDSCLSSRGVTRVLEWIIEQRGVPERLRCDNGPEFTSRHFLGWCEDRRIQLLHIQPGSPMQNGRVESFNGRLRDECLNANWFHNQICAGDFAPTTPAATFVVVSKETDTADCRALDRDARARCEVGRVQ